MNQTLARRGTLGFKKRSAFKF